MPDEDANDRLAESIRAAEIVLPCAELQPDLVAPNGTRIELVEAAPALAIPPGRQELVVSRAGDDSA